MHHSNSNQTSMNLYDRNRKVGIFFFLALCIIFLIFENHGSNPSPQALLCRTRHAKGGIFSPCTFPSLCPPSKYFFISVRTREYISSQGLAIKPRFLCTRGQPCLWIIQASPLKSGRSAAGRDLRSSQLQLGFPTGLISSPSGPFVWCFHACVVWLESSKTVFPTLRCKYQSPGVLLKCRFCFRISERRPEVLHFYRASKWCWYCWSMTSITSSSEGSTPETKLQDFLPAK